MSLEHLLRDEAELLALSLEEEFPMRFTPFERQIVIPVLNRVEHNEGRPFCSDPACPCREDTDNINTLNELIERGLLTKDEAGLIMRGATI
jgi:hypothetical protein